jgi:hypothetical protein
MGLNPLGDLPAKPVALEQLSRHSVKTTQIAASDRHLQPQLVYLHPILYQPLVV